MSQLAVLDMPDMLEVERRHQERERFFAAASHELGNAVAGIRLWAEHLLDNSADAPQTWVDGVQRIQKGADGAQKLIEDLLSLARIQEGRLTLAPWPADVSVLLKEIAEQHRPEIERAGLGLDTSAVQPRIVMTLDAARLRQIFVNLINNAIKFTFPSTTIHIGLRFIDDHITAWVEDEGPGVAPEDMERIFRPYEQVSGVARGRGAGLGLPLSRKLARLMGGDLRVQSVRGHGARFIVEI